MTFKSDKNFSITMILVKKGVTEKYYKPGTNLDTHVDVSYGHQEPYEQKRFFFFMLRNKQCMLSTKGLFSKQEVSPSEKWWKW